MANTEYINSQIDIRAVAEAAGAHFRGNSSACPIHGGDNPTAFSIFDDGRAWKCWTHTAECNAGGHDGIALLMALNGWTFKEVCEKYDKPIDPQEAAKRAADNAKRIEKELQETIEKANRALEELRKARRWLEYHDSMDERARELWRARGVADDWQDYLRFGYSSDFGYAYAGEFYRSPTLTIPTFDIGADEPNNVKHRLLTPVEPKSKYRYEKADLQAAPFYGDRDLPLELTNKFLIVEGEINAAVTMQTLDLPLVQVIGMPSKNQRRRIWPELAAQLQGHAVWIAPDPDAHADGLELARMIGRARMIHLPGKIDDMVNAGSLDKPRLMSCMDRAVVIK
jgi:hypothetical protein